MSDESKSRPHSAEIVILKPEELPEIPYIERATVARRKIVRADWRYRNFEDFNALAAEFEAAIAQGPQGQIAHQNLSEAATALAMLSAAKASHAGGGAPIALAPLLLPAV